MRNRAVDSGFDFSFRAYGEVVGVHERVVKGNERRELGVLALGRSLRRVDRGRRLVVVVAVVVAVLAAARIGGHYDAGIEIEDHRVARNQLALHLGFPETAAQMYWSAEG